MRLGKKLLTLGLATALAVSSSMMAFAGQWQENSNEWKYKNDDSSYAVGWQWIDGKCYYFGPDNIMLASTTTPDGFTVNESGAWVVDGNVQIQSADNGAIKLNTDFIKHEYIDCLGKDKEYLIGKFGNPIYSSEPILLEGWNTVTEIQTLIYNDIMVSLSNGKVANIAERSKNIFFNATKNDYTIEELDTLLGVKAVCENTEYQWYTWTLNENPLVELEYNGHNFKLKINL